MKITLSVDDASVRAALRRLSPPRRLRAQRSALQAGALMIESGAKRRAPVRTGFLRASIRAQEATPQEAEVTVGAEYGRFVEYGTSRQRARPYLRPTLNEDRQTIVRAVAETLRRWVEER